MTISSRVSTGIRGLDDLMGGGFQTGKTYLVSGEAGTGKSIFCMQYILDGLSKGENGVYLTIDEKPEHLVQDAATFGWDLKAPMRANRLSLMDLTPDFSQLRVGNFPGKVDNEKIVGEIRSEVRRVGAKRVAIDPIAPMFTDAANQFQLREYIRQLMFALDDIGTTNLVTSFIETGSNMISRFGVEEFFASGVIVLSLQRGTGDGEDRMQYQREMLVRKMRGTLIDLRVRRYMIDTKGGIVISFG